MMTDLDDHFEIAGKKLLLKGTSGLPKTPPQTAEGRPVRFDSNTSERLPIIGNSGTYPADESAGTHVAIGGPIGAKQQSTQRKGEQQ